jgi:hypothetical protein
MSFTSAIFPYINEVPPEAALHMGVLIGTLFGETIRKTYRAYLNRRLNKQKN